MIFWHKIWNNNGTIYAWRGNFVTTVKTISPFSLSFSLNLLLNWISTQMIFKTISNLENLILRPKQTNANGVYNEGTEDNFNDDPWPKYIEPAPIVTMVHHQTSPSHDDVITIRCSLQSFFLIIFFLWW
jgi:hypothetical protein